MRSHALQHFRLSLLLAACTACGVIASTISLPALPEIAADLHTSAAAAQSTLGVFLFGFASTQLIYGPLSDRYGRRPVMLIGLALYALFSLLCALATSIEALQIGRFLQGAAASGGGVVARAVIRDRFPPQEMTGAFALIGIALAVAPATAPAIGGALQPWLGWHGGFYAASIFGLTMLTLCALTLKESRPAGRGPRGWRNFLKTCGGVLRARLFLGATLATSLLFFGMYGYNTTLPFLVIDGLGLQPETFGLLMIFTAGAYLCGGVIARTWGASPRGLIGVGGLMTAAAAITTMTLANTLSVVALLAPMMMFMVGFGMILPAAMSLAVMSFPNAAGTASGLLGTFNIGAAALATVVAAGLFDGTAHISGWMAAIAAVVVLFSLGSMIQPALARYASEAAVNAELGKVR